MKNWHFLIWDDVILMEIVWRLTIEWEDWDYTLTIYDKSNKYIADIWYEDEKFWLSLQDEFIQYLYNC